MRRWRDLSAWEKAILDPSIRHHETNGLGNEIRIILLWGFIIHVNIPIAPVGPCVFV